MARQKSRGYWLAVRAIKLLFFVLGVCLSLMMILSEPRFQHGLSFYALGLTAIVVLGAAWLLERAERRRRDQSNGT
jgi:hypothetical protein